MKRIAFAAVLFFGALAVASKLDEDMWKLQAKLLAPCCYKQTLEVHESPLASQLRREIKDRLAKGESVDVIEADMVKRYGAEIRAIPRDFSLGWMGLWPFAFALLFGVTVLVRRARLSRGTGMAAVAGVGSAGAAAARTAPGAASDEANDEAPDETMNDRIDDEIDRL